MFSSSPGLYPLEAIAGDARRTKNPQINKVIGKNGKCVFYFTEKLNRIFGQLNIITSCKYVYYYPCFIHKKPNAQT